MFVLAIALLIGASLVVFGAGGSIVTMPVLVYAAGLDVHQATGTSLLVVGLVALVGSMAKWRSVHFRTGLEFGFSGMVGAGLGAWLNQQAPEALVLGSFAVTVLLAAARMAMPRRPDEQHRRGGPLLTFVFGMVTGLATGFFGVGGGFLIVPALTMLLGLNMRDAVGTSLFVIALNSAAGLVGHAGLGSVDWATGLRFAMAATVGGALAFPLAEKLAGPALQRGFAALLAVVGIGILTQTIVSLV